MLWCGIDGTAARDEVAAGDEYCSLLVRWYSTLWNGTLARGAKRCPWNLHQRHLGMRCGLKPCHRIIQAPAALDVDREVVGTYVSTGLLVLFLFLSFVTGV